MFNIIPLILILVSLSIIIIIVVRKFSVLAALDLETIQAEKEIKFKEQIITSRLKRNSFKYYNKTLKVIRPIGGLIAQFFSWIYKKLVDFKENYNTEKKTPLADLKIEIDSLFSEAKELEAKEEIEAAERKYIEIISLDSKNIKAFRQLADIYHKEKNYGEAVQTLKHILKLIESDGDRKIDINDFGDEIKDIDLYRASIYFKIALIEKDAENFSVALEFINKTLKLEPNNPKYLDTKIEICIINKDKLEAENALERLKKANPDNKKLEELEEQINEL